MTTSNNNRPRRRSADRGTPARRPIKVTPRRKAEIDPHLVSLVYYLIASRLVREAGETDDESPSTTAGEPT